MAKRSRVQKTDYKGYGRPHREHRSKKNRKPRKGYERSAALDRKNKLEMLKLKDLEE